MSTPPMSAEAPDAGSSEPSNHISELVTSSDLIQTDFSGSRSLSRNATVKTPPPLDKRLRRNPHSRSQSHTKIQTRLSTSGPNAKPNLSRSKSTDGIARVSRTAGIKRNNRSYTKLTGLQPLTKTLLNNSLKGGLQPLTKTLLNSSLKGFAPLRKTTLNCSQKAPLLKSHLDQLIRSNKSATSLKTAGNTGLKSSAKRGQAILKLNEDMAENDYEDTSQDSEEEDNVRAISNDHLQRHFQPVSSLENLEERKVPQEYVPNEAGHKAYISAESSTDDLMSKNLYGGSMLLSQSTGLTRKIPNQKIPTATLGIETSSDPSESDKLPDSVSGISFQSRPYDTEEAPKAASNSSYQPNQTIFSNLQRNNSQFLSSLKPQRKSQSSLNQQTTNGTTDFSNFLTSSNPAGGHNIETRTQQRLWLQRENSLMDIPPNTDPSKLSNFSNLSLNKLMFAHNYNNSTTNVRDASGTVQGLVSLGQPSPETTPPNHSLSVTNLLYLIQSGHQNSIQSRTEFERLNREYVNVRRHLNPVAESLNRVEKCLAASRLEVQKKPLKKGNGSVHSKTTSANSFNDFSPMSEEKEEEAAMLMNRLWQDALLLSSSSNVSLQLYQQEQQQQQQQHQMRQYRGIGSTPSRSYIPPTTRAVKLAAQAAAGQPSPR